MRGEIQPTRGVFVRGDEPLMWLFTPWYFINFSEIHRFIQIVIVFHRKVRVRCTAVPFLSLQKNRIESEKSKKKTFSNKLLVGCLTCGSLQVIEESIPRTTCLLTVSRSIPCIWGWLHSPLDIPPPGGGEYLPLEGIWYQRYLSPLIPEGAWDQRYPPLLWTNTHLWKHYRPATPFVDGKNVDINSVLITHDYSMFWSGNFFMPFKSETLSITRVWHVEGLLLMTQVSRPSQLKNKNVHTFFVIHL